MQCTSEQIAAMESQAQLSAQVNPQVTDSVLCVALDNSAVTGVFYTSPPEERMTSTNAFLRNVPTVSFASSLTIDTSRDLLNEATAGSEGKLLYEPGDFLKTFAQSSNTTINGPVLSGFGPSPSSSSCLPRNAVRFEVNQETKTCEQSSVDMEVDCLSSNSPFAVAPFVYNILVAKWPNISSTSDIDTLLELEYEVAEFDAVTGTSITLDTASASSLGYFPQPTITTNASTGARVCKGVLLQLGYTITHNGRGHLDRVRAKLVIGDVALPSVNSSITAMTAAVRQSFSVRFESSAELAAEQVSLVNGNVQSYQRSGNPGYLMHYPVRVGIVGTNDSSAVYKNVEVIAEMEAGLQLPGLDSLTSCTLSLSADEFEAFCLRSDPLIDALRVNFTHIANFGNSDPFLINEWLELDYAAPVKSSAMFRDVTANSPGSIELQCRDLITSVHLEFLVATIGAANNPQRKIIAARASHSTDSWSFWKTASGNNTRRTYLIYTTVTFVYVKTSAIDPLVPTTPPVWFSIPNDIFYPFTLNIGTSPWTSAGRMWLAVSWLVLGLMISDGC
ncbi:hypothetical protein BBJ28_00000527 [Nothophytophthora sp. Chile5]|nr:hypothetical protein BBJ28_00000527 [Nothophytophthora sp. Chile5]